MVKKRVVKKAKRARPAAKKSVRKAKPGKRASGRKATKRRSAGKAASSGLPESVMEKIGKVTHYFPHVNAAAVKLLKGGLKVGDEIYLKGHTTDYKEKVESIQLDHAPIQEGKKGQEIGLQVKSRVRIGDSVYRV